MLKIKLNKEPKIKSVICDGVKNINYLVSEDGKIFNAKTKKELKKNKMNTGYESVTIYDSGKKGGTRKTVHRLVAETFIPNPENKEFVNHKDGNKTNNCVSNLEWATRLENSHHAAVNGLYCVGEKNGNSKYSDKQVEKVCKLLQEGKLSNLEIAKKTGVSSAMVSMIKIGSVRVPQSKKYSWKTIKFEDKKGENHNMVKVNKETVIKICELLSQGLKSSDIANKLGKPVSKAIVNNIKFGKTWSDISCNYSWDIDHSKNHYSKSNKVQRLSLGQGLFK